MRSHYINKRGRNARPADSRLLSHVTILWLLILRRQGTYAFCAKEQVSAMGQIVSVCTGTQADLKVRQRPFQETHVIISRRPSSDHARVILPNI